MKRIIIPAVCLLSSSALAQTAVEYQRANTGTVNRVTYHAATGTFTTHAPGTEGAPPGLNSNTIYNNTDGSGFFFDITGDGEVIDEGVVPSTSNGTIAGSQDSYRVDGFQLGLASDQPTIDIRIRFYDTYIPCEGPPACGPTADFTIIGIPGSAGGLAVTVMDIDLTGIEFCLQADGHPSVSGSFGYSFEVLNAAGQTGPLISGDPGACAPGDGLAFNNPPGCDGLGTGSGLGIQDIFYSSNLTGNAGCFFFGGTPFAGFHMLVTSDLAGDCLTNDDCDDAQRIAGCGAFDFDNNGATLDGLGDPLCDKFGTDQVNNDIWYCWEAPTDGVYTISTCGATLDTKLAIYDAQACPAMSPLDCNDDTCGLQSEVSVTATAGSSYLIRLGTFSAASFGAGQFNIDVAASATNYCVSNGGTISSSGSHSVSANDDSLTVFGVSDSFGRFFMSQAVDNAPFGQGTLCVAAPQLRLPVTAPPVSGVLTTSLDFTDPLSSASAITPCSTWNFQYFFRTAPVFSGNFDLTDAVSVTFGL